MPTVNDDPVAAGREGGLKSAETRRAKAALRKDLRARAVFVDASDAVARALVDAALGRNEFAGLDPKERLGPMKTVLEMGVGRARPQDAEKLDEEEDTTGMKFGVRQVDVQEDTDADDPGEVEVSQLLAGSGEDGGVDSDGSPRPVAG